MENEQVVPVQEITKVELEALFGPDLFYAEVSVPSGDNAVQYVSAFARAEIYVTSVGDRTFVASRTHGAIDPSIVIKEIL